MGTSTLMSRKTLNFQGFGTGNTMHIARCGDAPHVADRWMVFAAAPRQSPMVFQEATASPHVFDSIA
ncbi:MULTISPECIES: hypothetical protein [unclassified Lysobacter]|uniref:hypothetical protein n=1 Tax=unclassified Lysobacter TaxID=2635362 RepID=UPI001BE4EC04|nr:MULTISPECIES: hypothetical protein [unclassified Lysobacter]MBT2747804.1 hypothetical protein [Lysobacter sp. ISL-42]MBT2751474.1 hypothetical protein [Lysobacter sp. ISL-50]MBT2778217.1 hypothetical protein [Lysobacter sp. ISL-54]MBT2782736.1 hypothetical protein [Lysobacter sp. ISL-52]